jgi:hypothetical protein
MKNRKEKIYKKCIVEGCENQENINDKYFKKGLCIKHYTRFIKHGDVNKVEFRIGENRKSNPLYNTYQGIKLRCYGINQSTYSYYGGRGIVMDNSWLGVDGFTNFCKDMGPKPTPNHTVDRKDNNGPYSKDNCKWATKHEQGKNKKNNTEIVGVSKNHKSFRGRFTFNKVVFEKTFKTEQEAINYRKNLENKYLK